MKAGKKTNLMQNYGGKRNKQKTTLHMMQQVTKIEIFMFGFLDLDQG